MAAKATLIGHKVFKSSIDFPRELVAASQEGNSLKYEFDIQVSANDIADTNTLVVNVVVIVQASVDNVAAKGRVYVDLEGGFKTEYSDGCKNEEREHLHYINAPAILLPYLRAFLSSTMLLAGLPVVYMPVHNLVEEFKRKKEAMKNNAP